jgi:hypothetical protein
MFEGYGLQPVQTEFLSKRASAPESSEQTLARHLDPVMRDALLARVRFYRDLGLTEFYRRPVDPALLAQLEATPDQPETQPDEPQINRAPSFPLVSVERVGDQSSARPNDQNTGAPGLASETWDTHSQPQLQEDPTIPPRKPISAPPAPSPEVREENRAAALQIIRDDIGD